MRRVALRNRVFFGAHETNLGDDRGLSARHVAYYRRRAAGGCAAIVTEDASVHPSDWPYERAPLSDDCAEGWAAVAAAVHAEGAAVFAGLGHAGGQGSSHWSQRELWAPSPIPEVNTREVPKVMDLGDIAAVVDGFRRAAVLAMEAGCDGVEVNAGQFSLVRQFLSGLTNQRQDAYADRLLFAREVLAAVREAVGDEAPVGLRLSCDELAPWAGITPEQAPGIAAELAESVDWITVVRGSIFSAGATRPDGHTPTGFNLELAAAVRAAVPAHVAVVAQGSLVDMAQASAAIDSGIDAVEMTRAQIADAEAVAKFLAGTPERIRPCVLCNQNCQVRDNRNPIVSCVADPRSGHETEDAPEGLPATPRAVLIAGGGPAGLELARVAAERGHHVTVRDTAERFGGAIRHAAAGPGRERLALLADWLEAEARRLGVTLEANTTVVRPGADPSGSEFDVTVDATGSRPGVIEWDGDGLTIPVADALADPAAVPDGGVLVWDPIGGPIGISCAALLASQGRTVHLATPDYIVGNELARSGDLGAANARLQQAGVVLHRRRRLVRFDADGAVLRDRFSTGVDVLAVGCVVNAGHRLPATTDFAADRTVGDRVAPRTIYEAILEGRRVGVSL